MKRLLQRKLLLNLIIALAIYLAGLTAWIFSPDLASNIDSSAQPRKWYLQIDTEPGILGDKLSLLVPTIERVLRSESSVTDLHVISLNDSVIASFRTPERADSGALTETISSKISAMSENRILQISGFRMFHQPIVPTATKEGMRPPSFSDAFALDVARLLELTRDSTSGFNIYQLAQPDLTIKFGKKKPPDPDVINTILQQVQSIEGVQTTYIKDLRRAYVRVQADSRQMLQTGISPLRMRQSLTNILAESGGVNQSIFSRPAYVMEIKPQSTSELCNIAISNENSSSIIRLCDIAEVSVEKAIIPYHEISASKNSLAKSLTTWGITAPDATTMQVIFAPDAKTREVEASIRAVLAKHPKDKLGAWRLTLRNPAPLPLFQFIVASLFVVSLAAVSLWKNAYAHEQRFHHIQILHAATLAMSILMGLRTPLSASDFSIFVLAAFAFALASHFTQFVHKSSTSVPFWFEFSLFSTACVLAIALAKFLANAGPSDIDSLHVPMVIFVTQLVSFAGFQIGIGDNHASTTASGDEITRGKRGGSLLFLAGLGFLAIILTPRNSNEKTLLNARFAFDLGVQENLLKDALSKTSNAAPPGAVKRYTDGPLWHRTLEVKPTTFSLMNSTKITVRDILEIFSPRELGSIEIQGFGGTSQVTPVIDVPRKTEFNDESGAEGRMPASPQIIEEFNNWSNTVQWPISSKSGDGKTDLKSRQFLPISTLMEARWENEFTRSVRTVDGESIILNWIVDSTAADKAKTELQNLAKKIGAETGLKLRFSLHDSRDSKNAVQEASRQAMLILTGLILFVGILFFASAERGVIAGITFYAIYLGMASSSRIYESLAEFAGQAPLDAQAFPGPSVWAGLYLFLVWATMLRVADYRRSTNMTLSCAFVPQVELIRNLDGTILKPAGLILVLAWWWPESRLAGGILLGVLLLLNRFVVDWMLLWSHLSEVRNRMFLRFRIRMQHLGVTILVAGALLGFKEARAANDTSLVNAECQSTATVILPIVGRPKGKEPAPRRTIFQEKLAQETPCAWIDNTLETEIVSIVEETRGPSEQGILVARLRDVVVKNRKDIEKRVRNIISKRLSVSKVLVYGGYYEEFFGNISFTIIDFRDDGDPVLTKMTFSVEDQTRGIAQLTEFLRGESVKFYEELLGEGERLPVFVEPTESLDRHPVSENLAGEISLFLQSRFLYPISFDWFERKTFFRVVKDRSKARYVLSTKIRREGTKFYATVLVEPPGLGSRRTAWIEGDISQLPLFEEEILSTSKRAFSNIEGITDYCIAPDFDFLTDYNRTTRMYGLAFRQNLGNAAIALRLRNGQHRAANGGRTDLYSLLDAGGGVGWQFFDKRWIVADLGLSLDAGMLSPDSKNSTLQARTIFIAYGGYLQGQLALRRNFALLSRIGIEQPILFTDKASAERIFASYYTNFLIGVGVTF